MAWSYTINGITYTNQNVEGNAYANEESGFAAILRDIVGHVANAWYGTSTSSLTIGTGDKSLFLSSPRSFAVGQPVRIAYVISPATTFMDGYITSYNNVTGAMSVSVTATSGSGSYANWSIFIGFRAIEMASSPASIAQGGTGASDIATARTNLGLTAMATKAIPLDLASGGTGATTAAAARTNLGLGTAASSASSDFAPATHYHEYLRIVAGQSGGTSGRVLRLSGSDTWVDASNADTIDQLYGLCFKTPAGIYALPGSYITGLSGLVGGTVYYLATAGQLTGAAPIPTASLRRLVVGKAVNATSFLFFPSIPVGG